MDYTQLSDTELQEAINFHRRQRNMSRSINEAAHMRQTQIVRLLEAEEARRLDEISAEKKMEYGKAAFADYHKQSKAKLGKILSGDKDTSGESRKIANRLKGISTSSKTEEVDLDEGVSNLSDARLKFHVLKDIPHGSYTKKEMAAEHDRRKKTGGAEYNAVKPSMNEETQLDEISKDLKKSYLAKAKDDVADRKKTISQANKLKNASRRNFHSHSLWMDVAYRNQDKNDSRKAMMAKAKESMKVKKEEVDLDEAKTDVYHQHMLKALGKTRLPKDHGYTSSIANNGDFVVRKGGEVAGRIPKGEHNLKEETMTPTDMKQRESAGQMQEGAWRHAEMNNASKKAHADAEEKIKKSSSFTSDTLKDINDKLGNTKKKDNVKEETMTPTDMKQREKIVKGMKKSAQDFKDRYGSKWKSVMYATATKAAMKEEVEELDEISRDLARSYIRKVADKNNTGEASPKEVMKRSPGVVLAGKKAYGIGGKARVNATEEVELDQTHQSEKRGE